MLINHVPQELQLALAEGTLLWVQGYISLLQTSQSVLKLFPNIKTSSIRHSTRLVKQRTGGLEPETILEEEGVVYRGRGSTALQLPNRGPQVSSERNAPQDTSGRAVSTESQVFGVVASR